MTTSPFRIKTAKFIKGIIGTDPILQDQLPQVAFIGRSNVGKSSLINSLTDQKHLAQSSSMPGKTRQINFFLVNGNVYFTDLPGYGFAKIQEKQREKLRKLILWYFGSKEARPKAVVLIVDAEVGVTDFDKEMVEILRRERYHTIIVANKIDKMSRGKWNEQRLKIEATLMTPNSVLYSAKTNEGKNKLLDAIGEAIG